MAPDPVLFDQALMDEYVRQHPEQAQRLRTAESRLHANIELWPDERFYRAHALELLQRVRAGESDSAATVAEVLTWLLLTGVQRDLDPPHLALCVRLSKQLCGTELPPGAQQCVPEIDAAVLDELMCQLRIELPHRAVEKTRESNGRSGL
jgi:hypothetical protein